jgi:hypothetical protein
LNPTHSVQQPKVEKKRTMHAPGRLLAYGGDNDIYMDRDYIIRLGSFLEEEEANSKRKKVFWSKS